MTTKIPYDLIEDVADIVAEPYPWWTTPTTLFSGRSPIDLVDTDKEHLIREWISAVRAGVMT